jgi:hypothetical protein
MKFIVVAGNGVTALSKKNLHVLDGANICTVVSLDYIMILMGCPVGLPSFPHSQTCSILSEGFLQNPKNEIKNIFYSICLTCSLMETRLLLSHGLGEGVEEAAMASRDLTRSLDRIVIWNPLQKNEII